MKTAILAGLFALALAVTAASAKAAPSGSISGPNEAGPYTYGDSVTFTTSTSGFKGNAHPMVSVRCYQDVNGDGLVLTPTIIVDGKEVTNPDFAWVVLGDPNYSFPLGTSLDSSQSATCVATLHSYSWKGGQESILDLASVQFAVEP